MTLFLFDDCRSLPDRHKDCPVSVTVAGMVVAECDCPCHEAPEGAAKHS